MTMPVNLIFVRHGQSEGNLANSRAKKGDSKDFSDDYKKRHSSMWRLTDKGRKQAQEAGDWLKKNFGDSFFRYYVSEYIRALETAAHLGLPDADWYRDFFLRERDWGVIDVTSQKEREEIFHQEFKRGERDGFYWAPPGGESMARLCLRLDRPIGTWNRQCSSGDVVCVCHGEVMRGFQVRLERLSQQQYKKLKESNDPFDKIHNCQILHYTRRNPSSGTLEAHLNWCRSICPSDTSLSLNEWQEIVRPKFTNQDLLNDVNAVKQLVNN